MYKEYSLNLLRYKKGGAEGKPIPRLYQFIIKENNNLEKSVYYSVYFNECS